MFSEFYKNKNKFESLFVNFRNQKRVVIAHSLEIQINFMGVIFLIQWNGAVYIL